MTKTKLSFEETLKRLEKSVENLEKLNISLDDALKTFDDGMNYYNQCNEILSIAKQKVEVYSK